MIDWLTLVAPLPHAAPICAGFVQSVGPDGELEWSTSKRLKLAGSFSSGIQVRTSVYNCDPCTFVEISGNPVKLFQGHNLWGTDDLAGLCVETLEFVAAALSIPVSESTRQQWRVGFIELHRVDVTESFHLGSLAEVRAFIRAADQTAHLPHRGRGTLSGSSTLIFGKGSRRWSLTLYSKGQEIRAPGHGQEAIVDLPHAVDWADRALRCELRLRRLELKRRGLSHVFNWFVSDDKMPSVVTRQLLQSPLADLTMTTTGSLPDSLLQTFRPALRTAYLSWASGADLRAVLSRPTFYRYRAELLPHGIDIAMLQPKAEVSNVVPLHRVLEAKVAEIPAWAYGTSLYFEPRAFPRFDIAG